MLSGYSKTTGAPGLHPYRALTHRVHVRHRQTELHLCSEFCSIVLLLLLLLLVLPVVLLPVAVVVLLLPSPLTAASPPPIVSPYFVLLLRLLLFPTITLLPFPFELRIILGGLLLSAYQRHRSVIRIWRAAELKTKGGPKTNELIPFVYITTCVRDTSETVRCKYYTGKQRQAPEERRQL